MKLDIQKKQPHFAAINLTDNAIFILNQRYLKRDRQGIVIETPEEMFRRVARAVAAAERLYDRCTDVTIWEDRFYRLMARLEFLPNSPTLLNAGHGQLSASFVLPVGDSIHSAFQTAENAVLIHKRGGGTGFSLSGLRPSGSVEEGVGGPVFLMRILSAATDRVKQGGIRRGCNIAVLDVHHPDIMKFILAKDDPDVLTNFYTSVAATDEFMEAVKREALFNLINPYTKTVVGRLNAKEIFDRIAQQAWKTGDPGIVFSRRIERDNPTPQLGRLESVCGCGEQTLLPYESCNLGSINLARMVRYNDILPDASVGVSIRIALVGLCESERIQMLVLAL